MLSHWEDHGSSQGKLERDGEGMSTAIKNLTTRWHNFTHCTFKFFAEWTSYLNGEEGMTRTTFKY